MQRLVKWLVVATSLSPRPYRAGLSFEAGHADRALARRRLDRSCDARPRDVDREVPRAADRDREQARRRRHHGRCRDDQCQARRLHDHANPHHRVSLSAHGAGRIRPFGRSHLPHRHLGLHLRRGRAHRRAVEDVAGARRLREGQSRQAVVRHARREHVAARHDGRHRAARRHPMGAGAVQRQRGQHDRASRRPHPGVRRRDRLGSARRSRQDAAARHVGREAHETVAGRTHVEGAGLRHRVDLAVRHRGAEGHGPQGREGAARRLQERHGRRRPPAGDGEVRPGSSLHVARGLREIRAHHVAAEKATMSRLMATQK